MTISLALAPTESHLPPTSVPPPPAARASVAAPPVSRPSAAPPRVVARDSAAPSARGVEHAYVYGDSTPFPHDWDCIAAIGSAVDACTAMLEAQHALLRGRAREGEIERRVRTERARLVGMGESVTRTLAGESDGGSPSLVRTAQKILAASLAAIDAEALAIEGESQSELARTHDGIAGARLHARTALERFARQHDLPGSRAGFRLAPLETGYEAEVIVTTPYGVEATFDAAVAPTDAWSKRRRVGEISPETCFHVPREAGWFARRTERTRVSFDKAYVIAAAAIGTRATLVLGKGPRPGAGWELSIHSGAEEPRVVLHEIGDDGKRAGGADAGLTLEGEDRGRALELWRRVRASLEDVLGRRGEMRAATVDDRQLQGEEPLTVAKRIVDTLAPYAAEVARRSGAPGELVLRRNLGSGRREEIYVTVEELRARVEGLAPQLRAVFEPLGILEQEISDHEEVSVSGVEMLGA